MNDMSKNRADTHEDAPREDPALVDANGKPQWAMSRRETERLLRERAGLPPIRRRWPWIVLALVLLAAAGGAAYWQMQRGAAAPVEEAAPAEPAPEETVYRLAGPEVLQLEPMLLTRTVRVTGTLEPTRSAELSSEISGTVETVAVQPGDSVSRGDILVQVDTESLGIDLDLARSNASATEVQLGLAQTQLERAQQLSDRGVATTSTLDEARSSVQQLQSSLSAQQDQVRSAELRLRNATLRAPFDGMVSSRTVDPGQFVQTGTPLMTVVDLSSVEMEGNAPVASAARLEAGQSVRLNIDGMEAGAIEGTVQRINPVASSGSRTITVYIEIDNAEGRLRGGMFATGEVVTATEADALALPEAALREDAEGTYVLRVEDGVLARAPVETGAGWSGDLTRVTEGLAPGDIVVSAPLDDLAAGARVQLEE
ncbi:efflux RND transporter periplasmic adaptor subunit [Pseudoroseicyclus aestuarii]|uniref:RND family efflux transporter MFP subunit n=1 Tax=Pseudoroseicyclus aestuarii TaxID=1795041 RepID=A0A318SVF9_9RHOB|nr:efflux RND transporter periplasmic adaptor subunit [Pseudoroseicyclus aestuarii]PYE85593.1 RND family efflux transporter MFP subunit [Pseudoroseicyclus aestuarii]